MYWQLQVLSGVIHSSKIRVNQYLVSSRTLHIVRLRHIKIFKIVNMSLF